MDQDRSAPAATHAISRHLVENIGRHSYDMWFGHATRLHVEGTCVEVVTESRFVADWISGHFRSALDGAARETLGEAARVDLRVAPDLFNQSTGNGDQGPPPGSNGSTNGTGTAAAAVGRPARRPRNHGGLRRLDDFVVGPSNKLAHDAAQRIAQGAAGGTSRLFLHGECGVGKTHLLQGIAQRTAERSAARGPAAVRYVTAEQFTNEYINAVRSNTIDRFRKRTRGLELLAIDDVKTSSCTRSTPSTWPGAGWCLRPTSTPVGSASARHSPAASWRAWWRGSSGPIRPPGSR
jgi:chromosomal replication initiator protein